MSFSGYGNSTHLKRGLEKNIYYRFTLSRGQVWFFEIDIRLQRWTIVDFHKDTYKTFRSYFLCDAVLDLAIKYFNGMALKSFYEATLKNQFAIESRTEKWRFFCKAVKMSV